MEEDARSADNAMRSYVIDSVSVPVSNDGRIGAGAKGQGPVPSVPGAVAVVVLEEDARSADNAMRSYVIDSVSVPVSNDGRIGAGAKGQGPVPSVPGAVAVVVLEEDARSADNAVNADLGSRVDRYEVD